MLLVKAAVATTLLFISTTILFGQEKENVEKLDKHAYKAEKIKNHEFCSGENWSNGDKVSFRDLREMTLPASGSLAVDGGKNGGIKVKGSQTSEIVVRACIQTWGMTEEAAKAVASNVPAPPNGLERPIL